MSVERDMSAYNAGARGGLYFGSSTSEAAAYAAGQNANSSSSTGPSGGVGGSATGLLLLPFLFLAPVAFVLGTCLYPLPGLLVLLGIGLVMEIIGDGINAMGVLLVVLVPGIAFFMLGMQLETWLEQFATYRQIRHALRLVVVGFVANAIVFSFRGAGNFSPQTSFLDRLSLLHVVLVGAAMVGAHFLSRRLDAKFGSAAGFFSRFRLRRKEA